MEQSFRQSMSMSRGDIWIFLDRPIVISFLVLSVLFMLVPTLLRRRRASQQLVDDDE